MAQRLDSRITTRGGRIFNEAGSKVEAGVAMCPLLSLFCREENRDGNIWESYALDSYRSTTTYYAICHCTKIQAEGATIGIDHVL